MSYKKDFYERVDKATKFPATDQWEAALKNSLKKRLDKELEEGSSELNDNDKLLGDGIIRYEDWLSNAKTALKTQITNSLN